MQEVNELNVFPDKSADLIYASHVLEHISFREVPKVLKEWRRVLKAGGVLRISVPDFDRIIDVYSHEGNVIQAIVGVLMGAQEEAYNFHKAVFNNRYLTELLLSVGFREVREWEPGNVELHSFEDWASRSIEINGKEYPISLNLEALK